MPSFKTHSIHGEIILPSIESKIEIKKEDIKSFSLGPDVLAVTDSNTFNYQHANKTRQYFCTLIKMIKEKKLLDNSEVMAFLYGQLDHFVLDLVMHPLIYYMTENIKSKFRLKPHALVESWIDEYTSKKHNKEQLLYYRKFFIQNKELLSLIDELYKKVYGVKEEGSKYNLGIFSVEAIEFLAKRNAIGIAPLISKIGNLGDFIYKKNSNRALPFLNLDNKIWYNPETKEEYRYSFDDLWKKSIELALETIHDVNMCLYKNKDLKNRLILSDTSYDTGLPCEMGQTLKYVKKYY